jgi:predicted kinase
VTFFGGPHCVILRGLPASGKSTVARTLVDRQGYCRVNKDDLRLMMRGGEYHRDFERSVVLPVRDAVILNALRAGTNVVVDDTNIERYHIDHITALVEPEFPVAVKNILVDVEECVRRDALRPKPVGESAIRSMNDRLNEVLIREAARNAQDG